MSETPSEKHNRLARDFVMLAGGQTHSHPELMVVIESAMLAALLLTVRLYGKSPADASIFMEAALQRATERFAEDQR